MVYLTFLLFSYGSLYFSRKSQHVKSLNTLIIGTIICLWTLIIGGQYNVGTDYFSYLKMFSGDSKSIDWLVYNGDYLFIYFIKFLSFLGIEGQVVFFVTAFIGAVFFFAISIKGFGYSSLAVVMLFFVCASTVFNNQMNTIRQYMAVYLFTFSLVCFFRKEYVFYVLSFVLAIGFHHSAQYLIPLWAILFFIKDRQFSSYILILSIVLGFVAANINILQMFKYSLAFIGYPHYVNSPFLYELPLMSKITKFIYIPFFMYIVSPFSQMRLNCLERNLLTIGVIAFSLKLATLNIYLLSRFGMYFEFLMIFPLIIFVLKGEGRITKLVKALLISMVVSLYALKVTYFARGEYEYHSIFFQSIT